MDYDSARHNVESLEQTKKRDELKIQKVYFVLSRMGLGGGLESCVRDRFGFDLILNMLISVNTILIHNSFKIDTQSKCRISPKNS